MSTSQQSIYKRSRFAAGVGLFAVALACGFSQDPPTKSKSKELRPFLDEFKAELRASVVAKMVTIETAVGSVKTYLARPGDNERLPAVILLNDDAGLNDWIKESAREIAAIGYIVVAPDMSLWAGKSETPLKVFADERQLAQLTAVARWLRRRADAKGDRIGVVGWAEGGNRALALASTIPLQACVVCNPHLDTNAALLAGLRNTPVLAFVVPNYKLAVFRTALKAHAIRHDIFAQLDVGDGFMDPRRKTYARDTAEQAWFEIYEFLAEFVEEFPRHAPVFPGEPQFAVVPGGKVIASIDDVMTAVMQPTGIRGTLIKLLEQKPAKSSEWKRVKALAAIVAESGNILRKHNPPRGSRDGWLKLVESFTATVETIMTAAQKQDYAAARVAVSALANHCALCHKAHR